MVQAELQAQGPREHGGPTPDWSLPPCSSPCQSTPKSATSTTGWPAFPFARMISRAQHLSIFLPPLIGGIGSKMGQIKAAACAQ